MTEFPDKVERRFKLLVDKHELSDRFRSLRRDLRPGFSIVRGKRSSKRGVSRFGGVPDVPSEFSWPASRLGNLLFVAQINLAELPTFVDPLPRRGYLLFFCGGEGGNARVFWYASVPKTLVPAPAPDADSFTPSFGEGPIFSDRAISFVPAVYLTPIHPLRCDDGQFWERHYELRTELEGPDSRLLGYSYYDPVEGGIDGGFATWETLLQVDSFEPCNDMLWADNGKLAFFVRKGYIKRCAFGRSVSCIVGAG